MGLDELLLKFIDSCVWIAQIIILKTGLIVSINL